MNYMCSCEKLVSEVCLMRIVVISVIVLEILA